MPLRPYTVALRAVAYNGALVVAGYNERNNTSSNNPATNNSYTYTTTTTTTTTTNDNYNDDINVIHHDITHIKHININDINHTKQIVIWWILRDRPACVGRESVPGV